MKEQTFSRQDAKAQSSAKKKALVFLASLGVSAPWRESVLLGRHVFTRSEWLCLEFLHFPLLPTALALGGAATEKESSLVSGHRWVVDRHLPAGRPAPLPKPAQRARGFRAALALADSPRSGATPLSHPPGN